MRSYKKIEIIIKCDFDNFKCNENVENHIESNQEEIHACCSSPDYLNYEDVNIELFKEDVFKIGVQSVIHKCGFSCYKKLKSSECRMGFGIDNEGKSTVKESSINQQTGEIVIKRNNSHVSDFNPFMMVGLRSNHNIQFLGASNNQCLKRIYYCTNYMTKHGISSYNAICFASSAFEKLNNQKSLSTEDYAKQLLYKTYNFAANHTEYSGAQVASMILNNGKDGTHYSSHESETLNVWEILKFLKLLKLNEDSDNEQDNEDLIHANKYT